MILVGELTEVLSSPITHLNDVKKCLSYLGEG